MAGLCVRFVPFAALRSRARKSKIAYRQCPWCSFAQPSTPMLSTIRPLVNINNSNNISKTATASCRPAETGALARQTFDPPTRTDRIALIERPRGFGVLPLRKDCPTGRSLTPLFRPRGSEAINSRASRGLRPRRSKGRLSLIGSTALWLLGLRCRPQTPPPEATGRKYSFSAVTSRKPWRSGPPAWPRAYPWPRKPRQPPVAHCP
jgi:hypothetical protein